MQQNRSHLTRMAKIFGLATVLAISGELVRAEDAGRLEYLYSCSACHGDTALGDGPVARFLNVKTPGLTTLAKNNDGVFPLLKVIQVIDGRTGVGPHGTLMPVWGERFMANEIGDAGPYGAEVIVRGRILTLAHYLETIQE